MRTLKQHDAPHNEQYSEFCSNWTSMRYTARPGLCLCCYLLLQGIGEALAKYLASQGARLILSSRSADKLQVRALQAA
jgi:hypothetical protein